MRVGFRILDITMLSSSAQRSGMKFSQIALLMKKGSELLI
jgi:hypothetical protein